MWATSAFVMRIIIPTLLLLVASPLPVPSAETEPESMEEWSRLVDALRNDYETELVRRQTLSEAFGTLLVRLSEVEQKLAGVQSGLATLTETVTTKPDPEPTDLSGVLALLAQIRVEIAALPTEAPGSNGSTTLINWPAFSRLAWRWIDEPQDPERAYQDSIYLWKMEPVDEATWNAAVSLGPITPPPPPNPLNSATILAESFVAALDNDPSNRFGTDIYPTAANLDVDIEPTPGGGFNIGYWTAGEWLEYQTPRLAAGDWFIGVWVSSPVAGGTIEVTVNGSAPMTFTVPNTEGWMSWFQVEVGSWNLPEGTHRIRILGKSAGPHGWVGNFDRLSLTRS